MSAADAGNMTLLISFREAADLSFQIALAVAVVVCGTSLATVAARSDQTPHEIIDTSRPLLWDATPTRIDRHDQLLTITVHPATRQTANTVCSDAIGLRIACDLVPASRRPS